MKRIAVAVAALCVALALRGASAQEDGWVVRSFDAQITASRQAFFTVTEDIVVDFGTLERHGIIREIPYEYDYEPPPGTAEKQDMNRLITISVDSVDDVTSAVQYETDYADSTLRIRIGDPDVTVSGEQRYRIRYAVTGAFNPFADHDELYWNVTGNDWSVPIEQARAVVALPGAPLLVSCFQGPFGSTDECLSEQTGNSATFTATRQLARGDGLTAALYLPKGLVDVPPLALVPAGDGGSGFDPGDFFGVNPVSIAITAALAAIVVIGLARLWWLHGRDRWYGDTYYLSQGRPQEETRRLFAHQTIVVEYQPPEIAKKGRRLRPAEIGLLVDERADTLDVSATIVDLAVRKYLRIKELPKEGIFGIFTSRDYELERLDQPNAELLPYERTLLSALFDGGHVVQLSELKNSFYNDLRKIKDQLYEESVKNNRFFPRDPDQTREFARYGGIGLAVAGGVAMWALGSAAGASLVAIPIIAGGVALFFLAPIMPRRTATGWEMYRRCLGFRTYMVTAETDRQKFAEDANIFHEYLPFAIVYGCVQKWAQAFEGLGVEQQAGWYVGAGGFAAMDFANGLHSFSTSLSGAMASTPGGSGASGFSVGGFSGGGFSGGGVGGGGGSSW